MSLDSGLPREGGRAEGTVLRMIGRALKFSAFVLVGFEFVAACGSSDRPSNISMENMKPCDLISSFEPPQTTRTGRTTAIEHATHIFLVPEIRQISGEVTDSEISKWAGGSVKNSQYKELPRILGFETITVWRTYESSGPHDYCRLYVDVADDQSSKGLRIPELRAGPADV